MEEVIIALVLLGVLTGLCIGSLLTILLTTQEPDQHTQKLILSQRDSIRALRMDFNRFRDNHDRELITLLRETLRNSPRSVASVDEEPNASS